MLATVLLDRPPKGFHATQLPSSSSPSSSSGRSWRACTQQDDPTEAELKDDLVNELREVDTELTADQADCYAGLLVDEVGVKDIVDVGFSAEPPDEIADEVADAAVAAREECGLTDAPR